VYTHTHTQKKEILNFMKFKQLDEESNAKKNTKTNKKLK